MTRAKTTDRPLLALACVATLAWTLAAVATAGRGLDLTDEGYYLLSYRWWDSTPRTFTGAPYLYGPVYELLGHDVRDLRLFRLGTVLGTHALLARSVWLWLRAGTCPALSAGTAAVSVLASGGVVYGWLPLSPGYNDISVLGAVVVGAAVLRAHVAGREGASLPWAWAVATGVTLTMMTLAKWTSAMFVIGVAVMTVVLLARERPRRLLRTGLTVAGTAAASLVVFHLVVAPLDEIVPPWWDTTALVASRSNSPLVLVTMYLRSSVQLLPSLLLAVAGVLLHRWSRRRHERVAGYVGAVVAVLGPVIGVLVLGAGLRGGVDGTVGYASLLVVSMAFGVSALSLARNSSAPASQAEVVVVVCLLVLPVAQAIGTGNPLFVMAVNAGALWVAATAVAVARLPRSADRLLAKLLVSTIVVGLGWVAVDGSVLRPYRTETLPSPATVATVATGSLQMPGSPAAEVEALRDALDASEHVGRPYLGFDEMAGLVLLLDGRSVGEAWYSAVDPARTAAGIESDCATLSTDPAGPVLVFSRPPGDEEVSALRTCGFKFPDEFKLLRVPHGPPSLAVYVPVDE